MFHDPVLSWRLAGAATWDVAVITATYIACNLALAPWRVLSPLSLVGSLFRPSAWMSVATLALFQGPAFLRHAAALTTYEPPPKQMFRVNGIHPQVAAVLGRLASRAASLAAAAKLVGYFLAHALSASLCITYTTATLFHPVDSIRTAAWYGCFLAALYHVLVLVWGTDNLLFPSVRRHRFFRIKQRVPPAAAAAVALAAGALACGSAASLVWGPGLPSVPETASLLAACWMCAFLWLMGAFVLEVVFTERLQEGDYGSRDVLPAMTECLGGARGEVLRDLALHDLSLAASDRGQAAWRRTEIFADESGERWAPLGAACVGHVAALAAALAEALPQRAARAASSSTGVSAAGGTKWNALPTLTAKGSLSASKQQAAAVAAVQCGYQRAVLSAHTLADLAVASLREDRFGVLQLAQPSLGDILLCLLGTLLAAQQFSRQVGGSWRGSMRPWRGTGDEAFGWRQADAAVYAVRDQLTTALYALVGAFGEGSVQALAQAKAPPSHGSRSDALHLLQAFIRQEQ